MQGMGLGDGTVFITPLILLHITTSVAKFADLSTTHLKSLSGSDLQIFTSQRGIAFHSVKHFGENCRHCCVKKVLEQM